ncbi:hypothetical protein [Streptomyces sp. NPDC048438]|uniref:hypothetical protein n=1 Tax=Streptomyces sp. NPDC048438 TaxID=3365551 RepID=UPI003724875D
MRKRIGTTRRAGLRPVLSGVTALLVLLVSLLASAGPASARGAGLLDVTCTPPSSAVSSYSPPLSITPQTSSASISYQLGPCVSLSHPSVTSGTALLSSPPRERTCLDLLGAGSGTFVITWNTGQTSTVSANFNTTVVGAALVVVITGTVSSGLFQGDAVLVQQTGPATDVLLCTLGLGTVSSIYSAATLEITSL